MIFEAVFSRLITEFGLLQRVVQRQSVLVNNLFREATVKSVDFEKGTAVVEAHGIESKSVQWTEQAGDIVEWNPLSEGQRVVLVSPGGDLGRAFIIRGGFTDDVPQPHNKGAERRVKIGDADVTHSAEGFVFRGDKVVIEAGGTTFEFTADGFKQTGGKQEHDGKNVGIDHVHVGVMSGPATTGPPQ